MRFFLQKSPFWLFFIIECRYMYTFMYCFEYGKLNELKKTNLWCRFHFKIFNYKQQRQFIFENNKKIMKAFSVFVFGIILSFFVIASASKQNATDVKVLDYPSYRQVKLSSSTCNGPHESCCEAPMDDVNNCPDSARTSDCDAKKSCCCA